MEYKDYYKVLGVDRKATQDEIKASYRRLARKFHPDVSKEANAEEKFKNLQEAYEVLKDPEKRTAYDELGSNWKQGQDFRPPPGWDQSRTRFYTQGQHGGGQQFSEEDLGGFSDFFSNLFGGGGGGGRAHARGPRGFNGEGFGGGGFQQRGQDQRAKVSLSLEDAFKGVSRNLQLQTPEIDANGQIHYKMRTLKVNIPAGVSQGQQLRLAGQGAPGLGGGPAGDLFLEMDIQPHHLFSVQGQDVYLTLPVTPWEAALGAEIKVPTLAGTVGLKLAPGSHSGQKLRLKGRGMPAKSNPGDQYAILQIDAPPADSAEKKELYEKMATVMPYNPRKNWPI